MSPRRAILPLVVVAALSGACGGDPPNKELDQARAAIEVAKNAGAELYARDEYTASEQALARANDAVQVRDYRLALNHALDARERAQNATRQAATRKEAAGRDAMAAVDQATKQLDGLRERLKAAERARAPARVLVPARRNLQSATDSLQKAGTAMQAGNYAAALEAAKATTSMVQTVARQLDSALSPAARRRH